MSPTSCRLWSKTANHKRRDYSQTVVMRQFVRSKLVQFHLPTDINNVRSCHQGYSANWPAFHSVVYWPSKAWLILFPCEGNRVLLTSWWTFCRYLSFHVKATYLPIQLLPLIFLCWCSVWQKCIPRNVEILKILWEGLHPMANVYISEHVWTISMLVRDILNVTLT